MVASHRQPTWRIREFEHAVAQRIAAAKFSTNEPAETHTFGRNRLEHARSGGPNDRPTGQMRTHEQMCVHSSKLDVALAEAQILEDGRAHEQVAPGSEMKWRCRRKM